MSLHTPIPPFRARTIEITPDLPPTLREYGELVKCLWFFPQILSVDDIVKDKQHKLLIMCLSLALLIVPLGGLLSSLFLFGFNYVEEIQSITILSLGFAICLVLYAGIILVSIPEPRLSLTDAVTFFIYITILGIISELVLLTLNLDKPRSVSMIQIALFLGFLSGGGYSIVSTWYIDSKDYLLAGLGIGLIVALLCAGFAMIELRHPEANRAVLWQQGALYAVAGFISFTVTILRCDDWLISLFPLTIFSTKELPQRIPQVTVLPIPNLKFQLENWLELNWVGEVHKTHWFWRYTRQQYTVAACVRQILQEADADELMQKVAYFADRNTKDDWSILLYAGNLWQHIVQLSFMKLSLSLQAAKQRRALAKQPSIIKRAQSRKKLRQRLRTQQERRTAKEVKLPLQTACQATIAGFYFLNRNQMEQAQAAFAKAPATAYGREMRQITEAFQIFYNAENLLNWPLHKIPSRPTDPKRSSTWTIIAEVQDLIRYLWLYQQCREEANRRTIEGSTREKFAALRTAQRFSELEVALLKCLLERWEREFNDWRQGPPSQQPMKPFTIPFIFARPLREPSLHVGRTNEMHQLKEAWLTSNRQPTVVHGLPLSGKTSLVLNTAKVNANALYLAWLDAKPLTGSTNAELLILAEIVTAVANATVGEGIPKAGLATDPYTTCENHIREICSQFSNKRIIVVIDHFDSFIEQLHTPLQQNNVIKFLWHLHQSISNLNYTFIMSRTPERFLFNHRFLFPRITHLISTPYFTWQTTHQLLQRPPTEYKPQFAPATTNQIYRYTGGQPYLIQLIGRLMAQNFNQALATETADPWFTESALQNVIQTSTFNQLQHNYFNGLLQFIAQESQLMHSLVQEIARRDEEWIAEWVIEQHIQPTTRDLRLNQERIHQGLRQLETWHIVTSRFEIPYSIQSNQQENIIYFWSIKSILFRDWIRST